MTKTELLKLIDGIVKESEEILSSLHTHIEGTEELNDTMMAIEHDYKDQVETKIRVLLTEYNDLAGTKLTYDEPVEEPTEEIIEEETE